MEAVKNKEDEDKIVRQGAEIPNIIPIFAETTDSMQEIQNLNSASRLTNPVNMEGNVMYLNSNLNSNSEFKCPETVEAIREKSMLSIHLKVLKLRELTNLCLNSKLLIFRR
ncbi:hypothetical protein MA16_Dca022949 [Dendrobium catenatum]|uniref:Uncharacterized protein n=1 Tax=Dendrobium catenatum TaxID=906689 RepID=A0A2I0XFN6_9ASPA|nr:hypothetical protein MA16_Dca022949 [Dendrobium catenatum]